MRRSIQALAMAAIALVAADGASAQLDIQIDFMECQYELWAADPEPQIRYFVTVVYQDGSGETLGPFSTYNNATWTLWFRTEHNTWPKPVESVDIYSQDIGPVWFLVDVFDTMDEADDMADTLESLGLITDIRTNCRPRFFLQSTKNIARQSLPVRRSTSLTTLK